MVLVRACGYSRKIVGWALQEDMTETLVIASLRRAIEARQPPGELIHHTDRGGQYAAVRYREILRRASMRQSMSRAGAFAGAMLSSVYLFNASS